MSELQPGEIMPQVRAWIMDALERIDEPVRWHAELGPVPVQDGGHASAVFLTAFLPGAVVGTQVTRQVAIIAEPVTQLTKVNVTEAVRQLLEELHGERSAQLAAEPVSNGQGHLAPGDELRLLRP